MAWSHPGRCVSLSASGWLGRGPRCGAVPWPSQIPNARLCERTVRAPGDNKHSPRQTAGIGLFGEKTFACCSAAEPDQADLPVGASSPDPYRAGTSPALPPPDPSRDTRHRSQASRRAPGPHRCGTLMAGPAWPCPRLESGGGSQAHLISIQLKFNLKNSQTKCFTPAQEDAPRPRLPL